MNDINLYEFTHSKVKLRTCTINNQPYFCLQDICCALDLNNVTRLRERLDQKGVELKSTPTKGGLQDVFFINEKNVYKCIFKSRKKQSEAFQDWIFETVLPEIRKTGSYSVFQDDSIKKHIDTNEQVKNSKLINSSNYKKGGVENIIKHNRRNCEIHTGKTTKFIKEWGKSQGLKTKDTNSAKQVLRQTAPHYACAMSFADSVLHNNPDKTLEDISPASLASIRVFDELIKIGIDPVELKNNK